jgi:hypothetical protein
VRVARFLRILRLLRLAKLKKILMQIEDYIASSTLANLFVLMRLIGMMFFIAHWLACLWFFVGDQDALVHPITWITQANIEDQSSAIQYITSLYWAFTTLATVGYGDISPVTVEEKIIVMATMIIAGGVFAYTIGHIGALLSKSNEVDNSYREIFVTANNFMKRKQLDKNLQFRVRRYLEYIWEKNKENKIDEKELLKVLSLPLRVEIYASINKNVVRTCCGFKRFEDSFVCQITRELENQSFAPGDDIIVGGEMSNSVFFIRSGKVEIYHKPTKTLFSVLEPEKSFGEIAFFLGQPRTASVRSLEFADLLRLKREDYISCLEKFPEAMEQARILAEECRYGDFTALDVKCFVCEEVGHVVAQCKSLLIEMDSEKTRNRWINRENIEESKQVRTSSIPRFHRKRGKTQRKYVNRHSVDNVLGREQKETKRVKDLRLGMAVQNAEEMVCEGKFKNILVDARGKPRFSLFYESEYEDFVEKGMPPMNYSATESSGSNSEGSPESLTDNVH